MQRSTLGWLLLLAVATRASGHEDEKFLLDREPVYGGPGYQRAPGLLPAVTFPSSGITLLSWLTLPELDPTSSSGADCWGYVSGSGREYALMTTSESVVVVEVSLPSSPQVIAVIPGPSSLWRDVKIHGSYAYSVSEGGSGIQVINLTAVDSGIVTLVGNNTSGPGTTATHNVAINTSSGYLYRCGGGGTPVEGLRIYNLANPANPTYVASWNSRYVHDAQIVTYTSGPYSGREIAFCFAENSSGGGNAGLAIVDVTNKGAIFEVSFTPYSNSAFSHQGWLSPDRSLVYLNDELDEQSFATPTTTRVINVSNINSPFETATYTNSNTSIDHNLYTLGNRIFASNYRSGLRVFDATSPTAPVEVAYFDTYPDDDAASFNGLWSVYPYLPSGVVLGSDLEKGLFVWWVGDPLVSIGFTAGSPAAIEPAGESFTVQVTEASPGDLVPGSATLQLDSGAGYVAYPLVDLGGGAFRADFPASACGSILSYYLSGESTNGIIWTEPPGAPTASFQAVSQVADVVGFADNMETNQGWTAGAPGDDATTGVWTRVDPNGTAAQPEDDHSVAGSLCWVTGQGSVGGGVGENDVDGGTTTLVSPLLDLSSLDEPILSYWRWYNNIAGSSPGADIFVVDISNNDGASWTNLETVGPTGSGTSGGWNQATFLVSDFVAPTSQVRLRFVASDLGSGSIVEAAVDDVEVRGLICTKPFLSIEGNFVLGGSVSLRYIQDPGDQILAIYGVPPQVALNTPPYGGSLCIAPFQTLFTLASVPSKEFVLSGMIPNDLSLSGVTILFQGLVGPQLFGPGRSGSWTNCGVMAIQ